MEKCANEGKKEEANWHPSLLDASLGGILGF
jgi:hypothetical protein